MPIVRDYPEGAPCWADLMTTDSEGARAFYGGLFGWGFDGYPMPMGDSSAMYYMSTVNGRNVAGLMQLADEQAGSGIRPAWNTYFAVSDADAAAARVSDGGGTLLYPVDEIPGSGRMAMAVDPLGARFGLWQETGHIGSGIVAEPGAIVWNELWVPDSASAAPFYESVLGVEAKPTEVEGAGDYTELFVAGTSSAGVMAKFDAELPNAWVLYFEVADVDSALARAVDLGAGVMAPAFDVGGVGRVAGLTDPQGALFFVMTPAR
ncbi:MULTISPECIES: VOC family protein [Subtercola]|uniref:VOC family protein n=1 Tax=Subtercola vilae TaxID=2056433 RepID=A0A4T2BLL0_9MICO|nr:MULTISPECIES: VOC family protein [Subtercola]MEA9987152.1 VOC family protein [Subtercola sp. RTI3]TIH30216.1 VOC family protein [Subtercola vilae]